MLEGLTLLLLLAIGLKWYGSAASAKVYDRFLLRLARDRAVGIFRPYYVQEHVARAIELNAPQHGLRVSIARSDRNRGALVFVD